MHRIDGDGATASNLFTEGNAVSGVPATSVTDDWLNDVQEELCKLIEATGATLVKGTQTQTLTAVSAIARPGAAVNLWGRVAKGDGATVNLPAGMIWIEGVLYRLPSQANWTPTTSGHHDGTVASLDIGVNVYLWGVVESGRLAKWFASTSPTMAAGYTSSSAVLLGGFHVGRVRPIAFRYNLTYVPLVGIVPNSCWDQGHRPTCDPSGMVEIIPNQVWADIYPMSIVSGGTWPAELPQSKYGVAPMALVDGATYAIMDLIYILGNGGKRLPTLWEWFRCADGAPAGLDGSNDQAWTKTDNTAPTTCGAVVKAVSSLNCVDTTGQLWEFVDTGVYDDDKLSRAWGTHLNSGQDAAEALGQVFQNDLSFQVAGGGFQGGVKCGSRALYPVMSIGEYDLGTTDAVGVRGFCDSQ